MHAPSPVLLDSTQHPPQDVLLPAVDIAMVVVDQLTSRCLHHAASWLSELFLSCPASVAQQRVNAMALFAEDPPLAGALRLRFALGRSLFEKGEFQRCHHHLTSALGKAATEGARGGGSAFQQHIGDDDMSNVPCPQIAFLACYSLYMDGLRLKTTQSSRSSPPQNPHLRALRTILLGELDSFPGEAYLSWLCGVVCRDLGFKQDAAIHLLSAVAGNPFFWSAWEDLATLICRSTQLDEILSNLDVLQIPVMTRIFAATVKADLQLTNEACTLWERLLHELPESNFVKCQAATSLYHQKEFDQARALYEEVRVSDPFRLEGIDDYSNTLFVRGDRLALSVLAHDVAKIDPYRAESNCIIGNYYAIMQRHDKALLHFRRAVAIDPQYLSAWTLMGHSYLEVKNTSAAVQAYRNAVELDMRDYRAWYGLGQIYELLQMYHYALYYYWQTTNVRATDPRMWTAVANCLDKQGRTAEAVLCLQRAEEHEATSGEGYGSTIRRIVEYLRVGNDFANNDEVVVSYLNKLIGATASCPGVHSPWVKREDVTFALPFLLECHMRLANEALQVPNRSPSCDTATAVSVAVATSAGPRPSADLRKATGSASIAAAETYLALLPQYDVKIATRQLQTDIATAKVYLAALK